MCEQSTNTRWKDVQNNFIISDDAFKFDLDKNGFPALTAKNVKRINFLINNDSNYRPLDDSGDSSISKTIHEYGKTYNYDEIFDIVRIIDKLNSTRQSSKGPKTKGGGGRDSTAKYIHGTLILKERFYNRLKSGDPNLVIQIAKHAIEERYTISFASKYCTYVARALFKDDQEKADRYCIIDKVICDILPYYSWVYLGEKPYTRIVKPKAKRITNSSKAPQYPPAPKIVSTIKDEFASKTAQRYEDYCKLIKRIRENAAVLLDKECGEQIQNKTITNKDFDHLLWYYFKGDSMRIKKALKLVGNNSARLL